MRRQLRCAMLLSAAVLVVAAAAAVHSRRSHELDPTSATTAAASYAVWVMLDAAQARSDLPFAVSPEAMVGREPLDTDRPINPALIERIAATGAHIRYASRWLRAVAVDADRATLARITALPEVLGIIPLRKLEAAAAPTSSELVTQQDSAQYFRTWPLLRELNIPVLHTLGFTGAGLRIAILDSGFNLTHETLATRTVGAQRDFINNDNNVSNEPGELTGGVNPERHGTAVWSLLGGFAPTRLIGGAYGATFLLAKVDVPGGDTRADEDRWVAAVEWADSLNADLINSSIGFRDQFTDRPNIPYGDLDGNTTITTRMADEAARRNIIVVIAMGNDGPQPGTLWAPADADSVISVGGTEPLTNGRNAVAASISSRGPAAGGRLKPDVSARGTAIEAASPIGTTAYEQNLTGSSFATPLITASAALFRQAWPTLSILAVREALRLAGSNARAPDNSVGYGVPDVAAAIMMPEGLPVRLQGTDFQGVATTIVPTFQWFPSQINPLMLPIRYVVDVAADSLFTNVIYTDTTSAFSLTARRPLRPIPRAYWRVTAVSGTGVRRTALPQPPFTMPQWVRLLTLASPLTEFIQDPRPELSWVPLQAPEPVGPFTYDVEVIAERTGEIVQQLRNLTTSAVRIPQTLTPNESYRWRVIAHTRPSIGMADTVQSPAAFIVQSDEAPPATILYQNFPNPFPNSFAAGNSNTRVWFDLARAGPVELSVHDIRGRLVRQLIPARSDCAVTLPAGLYGRSGQEINCGLLEWDGKDSRGEFVPRGVYILRLRAAGVEEVRRMLFLPN